MLLETTMLDSANLVLSALHTKKCNWISLGQHGPGTRLLRLCLPSHGAGWTYRIFWFSG